MLSVEVPPPRKSEGALGVLADLPEHLTADYSSFHWCAEGSAGQTVAHFEIC